MTTVYFGNLAWSTTEESLENLVSATATPTECSIAKRRDGSSNGYALATFNTQEDADLVIQTFNEQEFEGRTIQVREDRGKTVKKKNQMAENNNDARPAQQTAPPLENAVYLGNLAWATTEDSLRAFISNVATPVECNIAKRRDGTSNGYALATFNSLAEAELVINSLNEQELEGRSLQIRIDRGKTIKKKSRSRNKKKQQGMSEMNAEE